MCSRCDWGYAARRSDGQCYGKYFVSDSRVNTVEPAKLAFGHQSRAVTPSAGLIFLRTKGTF